MPGEDKPLHHDDKIDLLLQTGGIERAEAPASAGDLVRQVVDLYGSGLRRIMDILRDQGKLDDATVAALTGDSLVSGLLVLHGLHPRPMEARVAAAVERLRPYLGSQGRDVELEGTSQDGVVRLRLVRTHPGGPPSSVSLKSEVEAAIRAAAPEVTAIDVAEVVKHAGPPELIPVDSLPVRANNPAVAAPAGPWQDMSGGTWEPVPEIASLESGEVAAFLVGGYPVLACHAGQELYAYRDYCPRCTGSLAGATLRRAAGTEAGGSLLGCPTCRGHFDVRHGGACLEDRDLHLDPLPLLVQGGVLCVAIPGEPEHAGPLPAVPPAPGPTEATPAQAIPLVAPAEPNTAPVLVSGPASPAVSIPAVAAPELPVMAAAELPAAAAKDR